jgi:hypothetical protein
VVVTGVRRGELCGLQIRYVDLDQGLVHVAFNHVVRGDQRVRKDTKIHQDRWLAIDPDTCVLIVTYLDEISAALAAVDVELRDDAYLFSNDPAHAQSWNPDWVTHQIAAAAHTAGVELDIKASRTTPPASSELAASTCATPPPAERGQAPGSPVTRRSPRVPDVAVGELRLRMSATERLRAIVTLVPGCEPWRAVRHHSWQPLLRAMTAGRIVIGRQHDDR